MSGTTTAEVPRTGEANCATASAHLPCFHHTGQTEKKQQKFVLTISCEKRT